MKLPVNTVPIFYLKVYSSAVQKTVVVVFPSSHLPSFCKKNHNTMVMIVENCSIANTNATHHYIVNISNQMYYRSFPTLVGSCKISNLRDIPPMITGYGVPVVSGTTKVNVSLEKPAVVIACTITIENTKKNSVLNITFYKGCIINRKFCDKTSDANLMQLMASLIALKLMRTNTQ